MQGRHLFNDSRLCVGEPIWYGTACGSKRVISLKSPGRYRARFRTGLGYWIFAKATRSI
jgi:hypothetical protein